MILLFGLSKRERAKWPRQLKTTREGKLLIGLTLGLGFGAINSGNNLLYMVLGMLLSLIVVSGILSELSLRGVRVRRRFKAALHAGRETFLAIEITNTKPRMNSFSIEVEELFEDGAVASQRPAYTLLLGPGETQQVALRVAFKKRGVHKSKGLRIATRYPFSFFRKSRDVPEELEFVAYPAIHAVAAPHLGAFAEGAVDEGRRLGRGGEYHGLREHRFDDDPRDIHWKTSARIGRLVSREYERPADRRVWLLVPNASEDDTEPSLSAVEDGISEAASLATHYTGIGWAVGVQTLDGVVEPGGGAGHLTALLHHLALVPVYAGADALALDPIEPPSAKAGERLLVQHETQRGLALLKAERVHTLKSSAEGLPDGL